MNKDQTVEAVHNAKKILFSLLVTDKLVIPELVGIKSYLYFNQCIYNIILNLNLYAKLFSQELTSPAWPMYLEEANENDTLIRTKIKRLRNMIIELSEWASRTQDSVAGHWLINAIDQIYIAIEILEILNMEIEYEGAHA